MYLSLLKLFMNKKLVLIVVTPIVFILVFIFGFAYVKFFKNTEIVPREVITQEEAIAAKPFEQVKTELNKSIPEAFPKNLPLETDLKIDQSYVISYETKKQSTLVFSSNLSVKENYYIYSDFLKNDKWNIINDYSSSTEMMSLYATKFNFVLNLVDDITITITKGPFGQPKSEVSISLLKN